MKLGLLWFDDDPRRDLDEKIARAARHYERKFGRRPNVCYVHPSLLGEGPERRAGMRLEALPSVLRDHLWLGEEQAS